MGDMVASEYDDVLLAFVDANIGFVVTGGAAVELHGYSRPIADLDVVVDPALANLDAVVLCMVMLGFYPTLPLPLSAVLVMRMFDVKGREVDINRVYPVGFADLIKQARFVCRNGRKMAIASKAHLILVKTQRRRDYDIADVQLLGQLA